MPTGLSLAVVLVFAAVALVTGAVASAVVGRVAPARRRLENIRVTAGPSLIINEC